jgi:hypothetical protein
MSCVDAADHHLSGPVLSLDAAWRCYCRDRDGIILPEPGRDGRPRSQDQGSDTEHQIASGLALYSMPIFLFDSLTGTDGWVNVHTCRLHRPCRHSHSCLGRHCNWLNIDLSSCKKKKCLTLAVGDFTQSEATESFPSLTYRGQCVRPLLLILWTPYGRLSPHTCIRQCAFCVGCAVCVSPCFGVQKSTSTFSPSTSASE